jgi:hypothetical protein
MVLEFIYILRESVVLILVEEDDEEDDDIFVLFTGELEMEGEGATETDIGEEGPPFLIEGGD